VAETAHPRRRDYFKPDFFNGIGQNRKLGMSKLGFRLAPKPDLGPAVVRLPHPTLS
jgi:hypothetical protein